jgi:membrane protein DedA with SNARE-associated domain
MSFPQFIFFTALGAGIWNIILITIWYVAGKNDDLVRKLLSESFLLLIAVLWTIVVAYIYYVKRHRKELRAIEKTIEHNDEMLIKKAHKKSKK